MADLSVCVRITLCSVEIVIRLNNGGLCVGSVLPVFCHTCHTVQSVTIPLYIGVSSVCQSYGSLYYV